MAKYKKVILPSRSLLILGYVRSGLIHITGQMDEDYVTLFLLAAESTTRITFTCRLKEDVDMTTKRDD